MSTLILPVMVVVLLVGTPIFAALCLTVFLVLDFGSSIPLQVVPQRMFAGIDNFTLLSIPLFILAAELMRVGGLADRFSQPCKNTSWLVAWGICIRIRSFLRVLCSSLRLVTGNFGGNWNFDDSCDDSGWV